MYFVCRFKMWWDWRDDSEVKSTCCSRRGSVFCSQNPHGDSKLPVLLVPGDLKPSSGLHGHWDYI